MADFIIVDTPESTPVPFRWIAFDKTGAVVMRSDKTKIDSFKNPFQRLCFNLLFLSDLEVDYLEVSGFGLKRGFFFNEMKYHAELLSDKFY
jgi:hypothetical protein